MMNRRHFLGITATGTAAGLLSSQKLLWAADGVGSPPSTNAPASASASRQRYRIAVCDWMILKRQKLGAFQLTKDIGADGVEVDMGSLGKLDTFDSQLAKPEVRQQFLDAAKQLNLEI
jgi:hypothetical protein